MKRSILLWAVVISSCSTQTTAPLIVPNHPFPRTFKQLSIVCRSIPTNWHSTRHAWYHQGDSTVTSTGGDAGNELLSFAMSYSFADSNFHANGDTTRAGEFMWVLAPGTDTITQFQYTSTGPSVPNPGGIYVSPELYLNQMAVDLRQIGFSRDSKDRIIVSLSGPALQRSLHNLQIQKGAGQQREMTGEDDQLTDNYSGTVADSSAIIMTFIP